MTQKKLVVTNDDGIRSPGLMAAVEACIGLGEVTVVAPTHQQTGMGRSLAGDPEACLIPIDYEVGGIPVRAYHMDSAPALAVRHALRLMFSESKPDLVISGINYGENLGMNISASGTIGAASEAASMGIPALAVSKQTPVDQHTSYSSQDWEATAYFLAHFAGVMFNHEMPFDVDVLKIDVPDGATANTPWKLTKLARHVYYTRVFEKPTIESKIGDGILKIDLDVNELAAGTDIHAILIEKAVSVTPLSLDWTSRMDFDVFEKTLRS